MNMILYRLFSNIQNESFKKFIEHFDENLKNELFFEHFSSVCFDKRLLEDSSNGILN